MIVTTLGELLIDFISCGINKNGMLIFSRNPGGAPANVVASIQKLGGNTAFIGMVGNDIFGRYLRECLLELNIDTTGLKTTERAGTTLAFVQLDIKGERSFSFYRNPGADLLLTERDVDTSLIDKTQIFHFGSLSLTDEPVRSATMFAVKYAKTKDKIISYDPNYRAPLWKDIDIAKAQMKKGAYYSDIIKVSEEELKLLTDSDDPEIGSRKLLKEGRSLVLVTMGEKGSAARTKNAFITLESYKVKTIDTTGAGDSFLGACLYSLKDKSIDEIANMTYEKLIIMLRFANAAAAVTTTRYGAIRSMPNLKEISDTINSIG